MVSGYGKYRVILSNNMLAQRSDNVICIAATSAQPRAIPDAIPMTRRRACVRPAAAMALLLDNERAAVTTHFSTTTLRQARTPSTTLHMSQLRQQFLHRGPISTKANRRIRFHVTSAVTHPSAPMKYPGAVHACAVLQEYPVGRVDHDLSVSTRNARIRKSNVVS